MKDERTDQWFDFDYSLLRVVPHVHVGAYEVVGVVLHSRTSGFIGILYHLDTERLLSRWGDLDIELVERELNALKEIARGDESAGAIGALPPSERFHWITAPRSAVVQPAAVHAGRSHDPEKTLRELFAEAIPH
ncbi:MAG: DUF3037 domain-containing protein [Rhodothermales bacterium]|nr:DUF3037 domain-containing protein [Rhodothermales bacterium]